MTPNCMSEGVVTMATEEETMTAAENGPREWATRMLAPGHAVILDTETSDALHDDVLEVVGGAGYAAPAGVRVHDFPVGARAPRQPRVTALTTRSLTRGKQ